MIWGVVRLFAAEPPELLQNPAPVLNGSAGVDPGHSTNGSASGSTGAPAPAAKPIRVTLVGAQADTTVVVRDGSGEVVWAGEIVLGEKRVVKATPPVTVKAREPGRPRGQRQRQGQGPSGRARRVRQAHLPPPRLPLTRRLWLPDPR